MMALAIASLPLAMGETPTTPAWKVLQARFSAVSVGLAFVNDTTGWTTFTDGASGPKIVKSSDSGQTWNPVNNSGTVLIATGFATKSDGLEVGMAGVPAGSKFSTDGENFKPSLLAPLTSQSIKYNAGRFVEAGPNGPCFSATGLLYRCVKIPLKYPGTGRYVAAPSESVIYFTAGQWPGTAQAMKPGVQALSRHVRLHNGTKLTLDLPSVEEGARVRDNDTYTAELWKSIDGGSTWTSLITSEGEFYFNDIDCADEKTCVAVGEGYGQDGSSSPGARVYFTEDGETFKLTHQEADGSSLMAAKAISATEHWAGGATKVGGLAAPLLALHTTDKGQTWANEHAGVTGQMITAMSFPSAGHGFATTVNALQISSLLEYA
jgi:photosystem II stability/assembly factor-like uncharacterized protein